MTAVAQTPDLLVVLVGWVVLAEVGDECLTCGEIEGVENECPASKRPCGHHCNCSWVHDCCHWCGKEWEEGEEG